MRRPGAGAVLLVAAALAGCGSTVQQAGSAGGSGQVLSGPDGTAVDPLTGAAVPGDPALELGGSDVAGGGEPGTTSSSALGTRSGSSAGNGSRSGSASAGAGSAPSTSGGSSGGGGGGAAAGPRGPGVSDDAVTLGFQYVDVGSGTGGVLGKDVSIGDPQAQAEAVKAWINKNGGMGGRTLKLVHYGAPYANYVNNPQAEYNKICTYYTEDHKVLGVAVYVPDETLVRCLAKNDVISVSDGYPLDRKLYSELKQHFYTPGSMSQDRGAEVGVQGHHATGFLKGAKIGLLRYDHPVYARADVSLTRALEAKGYKIAERFLVDYANTGKAFSDAGAAVLRFNQLGITHVKVLDNSGGITFAFMQAAENQEYRPFYALTTNNGPSGLKILAPPRQLENARAVSWWWGDVGPGNEKEQQPPAWPTTRATCLKIMKDAGVDTSGNAMGSSMITCDQLLLLKRLMDGAAPNSAAMSAAADGLGTGYSSPITYRTTLGPGRRDGATLTRLIAFDGGCRCWRYAGPGPTAS